MTMWERAYLDRHRSRLARVMAWLRRELQRHDRPVKPRDLI